MRETRKPIDKREKRDKSMIFGHWKKKMRRETRKL